MRTSRWRWRNGGGGSSPWHDLCPLVPFLFFYHCIPYTFIPHFIYISIRSYKFLPGFISAYSMAKYLCTHLYKNLYKHLYMYLREVK